MRDLREFSEVLFRLLLRAYPRSFRNGYEEPLRQAYRDLLSDCERESIFPLGSLWLRLTPDFLLSVTRSHFNEWSLHKMKGPSNLGPRCWFRLVSWSVAASATCGLVGLALAWSAWPSHVSQTLLVYALVLAFLAIGLNARLFWAPAAFRVWTALTVVLFLGRELLAPSPAWGFGLTAGLITLLLVSPSLDRLIMSQISSLGEEGGTSSTHF